MIRERLLVADTLRRFVSGNISDYEFDDFISIPSRDSKIEEVRMEIISLPDVYPPEIRSHYVNASGLARISEIADNLVRSAD